MNINICDAIKLRKVIHFYYEGGFRSVEPFCHGVSTAGNEVLRGYQTSGHSESGNSIPWRLFKVIDMTNISITNVSFLGSRGGYNPNDSAMSQIHCHV